MPILDRHDTVSRPAALLLNSVRFGWSADLAPVIDVANLSLACGENLFVAGPSGSGKSTLLSLVGDIAVLESGDISVLGKNMSGLSSSARDRFRADNLGIAFQQFNLLPYLSVAMLLGLKNCVVMAGPHSPIPFQQQILSSDRPVAMFSYCFPPFFVSVTPPARSVGNTINRLSKTRESTGSYRLH